MKTTKDIARELGLLRRRSSSTSQHSRDIRKAQSWSQEFSFLIVIDFESTCWKEKEMNTCQEIIEFPAVLLNTSTGAIEDEFHSYVLPMERPQLSKFCTEFTGITQAMVESSAPLCVILSQFLRWLKRLAEKHNMEYHTAKEKQTLCTFVTWSDWDLGLCLHRECLRKQLYKPAMLNSWIDLRATYKTFYKRKPNGLNGALQDVGIQFTGRQHSGLDDAKNTAQLAWKMICDGCRMSITKAPHQKAGVSRGLTKASNSGGNPSVPASSSVPGATILQTPNTSAGLGSSNASLNIHKSSMPASIQRPSTSIGVCIPDASSNLEKPSTSASYTKPGASASLQRPSSATIIHKASSHLHNPSTSASFSKPSTTTILQRPSTSVVPNASSNPQNQNTFAYPRPTATTILQRPSTSMSYSKPGKSTIHRPSTSVGVCMSKASSKLGNPGTTASIQSQITPKILQRPGQSVNHSGKNVLTNLPRSLVSSSCQMLSIRNVWEKTMTSRFRTNMIKRNGQNDIQGERIHSTSYARQLLCNKNTEFIGKDKQVGSKERESVQKSTSPYRESIDTSENALPMYHDEGVDLNAGFIYNEDKKVQDKSLTPVTNYSVGPERKECIQRKTFNPLQNYITPRILKQPMKTLFTKVKVFQAQKLHCDFETPGQSNTILNYLQPHGKVHMDGLPTGSLKPLHQSLQVPCKGHSTPLTKLAKEFASDHKVVRKMTPANVASRNGIITTPTWISRSCTKEKITPPMCRCGRRTRRKIASRPGPDQNRPFFVCPKSNGCQVKEQRGCGYFQWESTVIKNNMNIYQLKKNRLSVAVESSSAVPAIGTTPLNRNFESSIGKSQQIMKPSLRTAFRIKPY
ncbi:uncharacterized protein LOC117118712 [Anneissia japonica]|uniref:uncharacterized protein LOC117118712 n=1 Tax=Anneissia japonica TaxID=1529436 RepID=UPI001425A242|nr:uncharacterized protein LOC117118712 [Anneissia japonica]XP_033119270.1 uncharacterized protein LOC117118712 [Anneissia japonica]